MSGSGRQATNAKKLPTQQSVNAAVKQICDTMPQLDRDARRHRSQ